MFVEEEEEEAIRLAKVCRVRTHKWGCHTASVCAHTNEGVTRRRGSRRWFCWRMCGWVRESHAERGQALWPFCTCDPPQCPLSVLHLRPSVRGNWASVAPDAPRRRKCATWYYQPWHPHLNAHCAGSILAAAGDLQNARFKAWAGQHTSIEYDAGIHDLREFTTCLELSFLRPNALERSTGVSAVKRQFRIYSSEEL
jgi:hypothetical protein